MDGGGASGDAGTGDSGGKAAGVASAVVAVWTMAACSAPSGSTSSPERATSFFAFAGEGVGDLSFIRCCAMEASPGVGRGDARSGDETATVELLAAASSCACFGDRGGGLWCGGGGGAVRARAAAHASVTEA